MALVDLHLHTTASDGALSPVELVHRCAAAGVRVMAITDHDSTEGVRPAMAAAEPLGITVIAGTELNTDAADGEVHILGYFVDLDSPAFQEALLAARDARVGRAKAMLAKLDALGMPLSFERVRALAGEGAIGRPHVAQALVEAGYVETIAEAFERYLGRNGPAYAEGMRLSPREAVRLIRAAGGLPVLAHPSFVADPEATVAALVPEGLAGVEVFYREYGEAERARFGALARRFGLLQTGGSDFHGTGNWPEEGPGTVEVPWSVVEALFAAAGRPVPTLSRFRLQS
ncbi:MAG: PHP domain-containing protein [Chloroflexota bacterium]|nr:PHP domain-containing protein [Dehalococcoidia bacterium]MDW8253985.1 PHP domain-containing protein [Chloroflexota bacterium]